NRETYAGLQGNHLFTRPLAAPDLAAAAQDVPDLVDGPMRHGCGDLAGCQLEFGHGAYGESEQRPDRRAVRRPHGCCSLTSERLKRRHGLTIDRSSPRGEPDRQYDARDARRCLPRTTWSRWTIGPSAGPAPTSTRCSSATARPEDRASSPTVSITRWRRSEPSWAEPSPRSPGGA